MAIQKIVTSAIDRTAEIAQKALKQKKISSYPYIGAGTFIPAPVAELKTTHPYFNPTTPLGATEESLGQVIDFFAF